MRPSAPTTHQCTRLPYESTSLRLEMSITRERGCAGAEVVVLARTATERALQNTAFIVGDLAA